MTDIRRQILKETGLSEQEFSACASVNLPDNLRDLLDLSPADIVHAVTEGDLRTLASSRSVWLCGWEPVSDLARMLAGLRVLLSNEKDLPAAARFYLDAFSHVQHFGRIRHARLLAHAARYSDEPPTELAQRLMMHLRGKLRCRPPSMQDAAALREITAEVDHDQP